MNVFITKHHLYEGAFDSMRGIFCQDDKEDVDTLVQFAHFETKQ